MRASPPGWWPGIRRQILCPLLPASTSGCRLQHDTASQPHRDCVIVAPLPHLSVAIPLSTGLLHPFTYGHFGKGDAQCDDLVMCERRPPGFPIAFGDNQLDGLEPPLLLRIVPIAHADETVTITILCEQLLGALLARLEMQAYRMAEAATEGGSGVMDRTCGRSDFRRVSLGAAASRWGSSSWSCPPVFTSQRCPNMARCFIGRKPSLDRLEPETVQYRGVGAEQATTRDHGARPPGPGNVVTGAPPQRSARRA